jgi:hypothetical protein
VTGRQGRRRRKLLDDLKERRGYARLKEEALDRTVWRARFGRGIGPVVKQTAELINVGKTYWEVDVQESTWEVITQHPLIWLTTQTVRQHFCLGQ